MIVRCYFFESTRCLHSSSRHHSIFTAALAYFYPFLFWISNIDDIQKKEDEEEKKSNTRIPDKFDPEKMEKSYKILIYVEIAVKKLLR